MKRTLLLIVIFVLLLASCKSQQKVVAGSKNNSTSEWEQIFSRYQGAPYRYGGTTGKGFDCSGFVQQSYREARQITLPRSTKLMMKTGKKVSKNELTAGDLVFFHPTIKYYHVGIYLGDGIFMHASTSRGVTKSDINHKYWKDSFVMARRVLN